MAGRGPAPKDPAKRTGDLIVHDGFVWTSTQAEAFIASVDRMVWSICIASYAHAIPQEVR